MKSDAPVRIAVVGHTNTGKTSLLRTLTHDTAFGEVSDKPGTTRDVRGVVLNDAQGEPVIELYDTPGLEDAVGLTAFVKQHFVGQPDPVAEIEAFVAGDHGGGRYEQEAKVLRQLLRSDAAIYVIDVREPMLPKHREELRVLAACGRPLMPLLNFVSSPEANTPSWKEQLSRVALHVVAEFDTVVFDQHAERLVFEKLGTLLEAKRGNFSKLVVVKEKQRSDLIAAACRAIAEFLVNAAGVRVQYQVKQPVEPSARRLREIVRVAEQQCVDSLLETFRFDLGTYDPPELPLEHGKWKIDPFDPETARTFGIRIASNAAKGAAAGLAIDIMTGMVSLGAGAAIGAGLGAAWDVGKNVVRPWFNRRRGYKELALEESTLAVLAARQVVLMRALLRRGHATQDPLKAGKAGGWPSTEIRKATLRCRSHPDWSALNESASDRLPSAAVDPLASELRLVLESDEASSS